MEAILGALGTVATALIGLFAGAKVQGATARAKDREAQRLDFESMLVPLRESNRELKAEVTALDSRVGDLEEQNRKLTFALDDERSNTRALIEYVRELLAAIEDAGINVHLPRASWRVGQLLRKEDEG